MYICCKIKNNNLFDIKKFDIICDAIDHFVIGTSFGDSLSEWVVVSGYYVCNDGDYGDDDYGEVLRLVIDMKYDGSVGEYDENEYKKYKEMIMKKFRDDKIDFLLK